MYTPYGYVTHMCTTRDCVTIYVYAIGNGLITASISGNEPLTICIEYDIVGRGYFIIDRYKVYLDDLLNLEVISRSLNLI